MSEGASGRVIAEIQKNKGELLRISRTIYEGHELVDVRICFKPDGRDEWLPTKKGVTFKVSLLGRVIEALQKCEENHLECSSGRRVP